jgi:O-methyltransferase involved in polyketide biosynthesis
MTEVNQTLYIPLYGKAFVSKKGILLDDKKAEEIWARVGLSLKRKSRSKWLAYYMSMRAKVFDEWVRARTSEYAAAVVLHLGCGLDSRVLRVGEVGAMWVDGDFPEVIAERKRYFQETPSYKMLGADIRDEAFADALPQAQTAIVIMEGVSMYLDEGALRALLARITARFPKTVLLTDCYTPLAVKMSKWRNPVKEVGVSTVYGVKSPVALEEGTGLRFVKEGEITPSAFVEELCGGEKFLFKTLYAGRTAKKLYKLYEYESVKTDDF